MPVALWFLPPKLGDLFILVSSFKIDLFRCDDEGDFYIDFEGTGGGLYLIER